LRRLVLDQGCPRSTARILNEQGWEVVHVGDVGLSRASDVDILEWARNNNRVCVTLDADFHAYLAVTNASTPSTVRLRREGLDAEALAQLQQKVWPTIEDALDHGAMVTVTRLNVRLRRLPLVP
jgi:predicted nuclease of predicted toxin-antitoxin system